MKKKIIIIVCVIALIVNVFPSLEVKAATYTIPGVITQDAVADFDFGLPLDSWNGGQEGLGAALSHFVNPSDCFPFTNTQIDDRGVISQLSKLNTLELNLDDYYYCLCGNYGPNIAGMSLLLVPKNGEYVNSSIFVGYQTYNGSATGSGSNRIGMGMLADGVPSDVTSLPFSFYNCSWSGGSNWSNWSKVDTQFGRTSVDNLNSIFYFYFPGNTGYIYNLIYSNMDVFFLDYATWNSGVKNENNDNYSYTTYNIQTFCNKHFGLLAEYPKGSVGWYNFEDAPYYNGTEIVGPPASVDDIPENKQIAFKSIDILQVYNRGSGAQSDARLDWTMDDNSFDFSDYPVGWRMNFKLRISGSITESASYRVFTPTQNKLYFEVYVPYDLPLNGDFSFSQILIGHTTFELKDALEHEGVEFYGSEGAVGALALMAYGMDTETSYAFQAASFGTSVLEGFLEGAGLSFPRDVAYDITLFAQNNLTNSKSGYAYVLDSLQYDVTARCYNPSNNLKSRLGEASVNMVSGEHTSQAPGAVIDQENGSSVELPDYLNTGDTYLTLQYDQNGTPVYVVNNISLPSGAGGGNTVSSGGSAYATVNFPNNLEMQIVDDCFDKFVSFWNESNVSPATISSTFWGFFGQFRDNPIADIYGDYFGFLPEDFRNYILGLAGIGFGTTLFCACRRRLT